MLCQPQQQKGRILSKLCFPKNLNAALKAQIPADSSPPQPLFQSLMEMSVKELCPHGQMGLAVSCQGWSQTRAELWAAPNISRAPGLSMGAVAMQQQGIVEQAWERTPKSSPAFE